LRLEEQGRAVHAIPLSGRRRTVVEDVAEIPAGAGGVDITTQLLYV